MKKICIILGFSACLYSCKKDSSNQAVPGNGKFEYKVNGQLYSYENVDPLTQYVIIAKQLAGLLPHTRYLLNAVNGSNSLMTCALKTDSLGTGTFVMDSTSGDASVNNFIHYGGNQAALIFRDDNLTFNITSHSNGRVSGTFSGKMTPVSAAAPDYYMRATVIITDGKLDNVQVTY